MEIFKVQYGGERMDEPILKKGSNAIYETKQVAIGT